MGTRSVGPSAVKKKAGWDWGPRDQKQQRSLVERRGMTLLVGRQQLSEKLFLKLLVKLQLRQESGCQSGGALSHVSAPGHQGEGHSPEKAHAALPTGRNPE